jgi:hypothetical protein
MALNSDALASIGAVSRQFKPAETGSSKKFAYDGSGKLSLAPFELRAITSIVPYTARGNWGADTVADILVDRLPRRKRQVSA